MCTVTYSHVVMKLELCTLAVLVALSSHSESTFYKEQLCYLGLWHILFIHLCTMHLSRIIFDLF